MTELATASIKKYVTICILTVATIFISFGSFFVARHIADINSPPVIFSRMELLNPDAAVPGGVLRIRSYRNKIRLCVGTFDRFLMHYPVPNEVAVIVYRDSVPGGFSPVGVSHVDFVVPVPDFVEPGEYAVTQVARYRCGANEYVIQTPFLHIQITARR